MDGTEKYTNSVQVSPAADTATDCFTISYPTGLSATHFLKLKLKNGSTVLADNFYWRGTTYQNYTALAGMNQVTLSGSATRSISGSTQHGHGDDYQFQFQCGFDDPAEDAEGDFGCRGYYRLTTRTTTSHCCRMSRNR